jgi:hypothetical protein
MDMTSANRRKRQATALQMPHRDFGSNANWHIARVKSRLTNVEWQLTSRTAKKMDSAVERQGDAIDALEISQPQNESEASLCPE